MNRLLYIALYSSLLLAFTACTSDDAVQENNDTDKSPIELTVGIADGAFNSRSASRAITADPNDASKRGTLPTGTALFMVMKSEKNNTDAKWAVTKGVTGAADDNKFYAISFSESGCTRYWDDCYARDAQLSVFAACAPGSAQQINIGGTTEYTHTSTPTTDAWSTTANTLKIANWSVSTTQTAETLVKEDLCYSNNISKYTPSGGSETDARLKFNSTSKKFDTGNLCFYHALSQFTIKIKCGDGFKGDGSDFKFTDGTGTACTTPDNSFALNGFYGANGVFLIGTGEFDTFTDANLRNFTSIYKASETHQKKNVGEYYTLKAYVYPGTDMTGIKDDAFSFIIDGNKYDISLATLYNAIKTGATNVDKTGNASPAEVDPSILDEINIGEGGKKLKAGVNYEFTFTVEKTKISGITAQVVDWEGVVADNISPSNAKINLVLEERGAYVDSNVDFYRAKDPNNSSQSYDYVGYKWESGYNPDGKATGTTCIDHVWKTPNWYWPDNTTFYHFRAVSPTTQTITTVDNVDYTSLTAGESYTDVVWGAPFRDNTNDETAGSFKLYYDTTNGFDATGTGSPSSTHQIYKAIGPTNDQIKLLMFHMMSDVTIKVQTTTGDDKVTLKDGENETTIKFENIYTTGSVAMGNGLVSTTGSSTTTDNLQMTSTPNQWVYGAIPQNLDGPTAANTDDIILVITTPDKNEYRVSMKDVVATTPTYHNVSYPAYTDGKVNYWYPGVKYTYTFKLSKKKIESITATILGWENVKAGDENIQIK